MYNYLHIYLMSIKCQFALVVTNIIVPVHVDWEHVKHVIRIPVAEIVVLEWVNGYHQLEFAVMFAARNILVFIHL